MLGPRQRARISSLLGQCAEFLPGGCVFMPRTGEDARMTGRLCAFCRACLKTPSLHTSCRRAMISGAFQALGTGEPYYSRCWAGLNTVVFPVAPGGRLEGAFEIGGFLYPGEREETAHFVADALTGIPATAKRDLLAKLASLPEWTPLEVRGIAEFVFEGLFSSGINQVDHFRELHDRYRQQRRLGELVQEHARSSVAPGELPEVLAAFAHALAHRAEDEVMRQLDEFFSRVLLASSLEPAAMKAHIQMLLAYLCQTAILAGGQPYPRAMQAHMQALRDLDALVETEDICYWTFAQVRACLEHLGDDAPPRSTVAERVLAWIDASFRRPATLNAAAKDLGASVSTIVQALRKETRRTFLQHLRERRVREARSLLTDTDLSIAQIATQAGFCDQSHLTRTFSRELGVTPRRYRQLAAGMG